MTSVGVVSYNSWAVEFAKDIRGPAGRISLLLLVWNAAALIEFRVAADRIRAMRDVIEPLCGVKVVYLLKDVGLASCVLKAVRT